MPKKNPLSNKEKEDIQKMIGSQTNYHYTYEVDEYVEFTSFLSVRVGDHVEQRINSFDKSDIDIIKYALSKRDRRFFFDKKVTVNLQELVYELYPEVCDDSYDLVTHQLTNIFYRALEINIYNSSWKAYRRSKSRILQELIFKDDEISGKKFAVLHFTDRIVDKVLFDQTLSLYPDLKKKIREHSSRLLINYLQKTRMSCYLRNEDYTQVFTYNFFISLLSLRSKKFSVNLNVIKDSLEEFKTHQIFIQDYNMDKNEIEISFIPLTDREKKHYFYSTNKTKNLSILF